MPPRSTALRSRPIERLFIRLFGPLTLAVRGSSKVFCFYVPCQNSCCVPLGGHRLIGGLLCKLLSMPDSASSPKPLIAKLYWVSPDHSGSQSAMCCLSTKKTFAGWCLRVSHALRGTS